MPIYQFGDFEFDTGSGEVKGPGSRARLRPQPAAILEHMLQHQGQVIGRVELQRVVWPEGTYVHFDHGLNSCIKQIRAALRDSRSTPRYIETLTRRGYRFIEPVRVADEPEPPGSWSPPINTLSRGRSPGDRPHP
jgi:cholera toxin transcriptional activator